MSSYAHAGAAGGASSTTGTSASGFPLRSNFFRSLPLSKETVASLYGAAKHNAAACLHQSFNEQWRYVPPEKDGTQLRKDTSNLATSCRFVRAATVLRCQEHEMNMVISNTSTDSWREFMRKCFGKHYIDTMILHSFSGSAVKDQASDNNRAHRAASDRLATTDGARATLWQLHGGVDTESDDAVTDDGQKRRNSDTQSLASDDDTMTTATATPGEGTTSDDAPPQELLTIKWGAFDTGGQGKRDLCVLDYLTTTTLPNHESSTNPNERVYMWCFSSVEGERVGCMALKDTHSIARATLSKLAVFWRRVSDEETEVIVCGSFASKHAKYVSAIFLQSLNRLQGIVEDLRLSNQIYIQNRSAWVKDHERSSCHLCMRNFYALRRKHHCRKCGEVICSDCSVVENVDLPVIGVSKLRLCKVCCLKAKSTPLKHSRDATGNVFDHLVRARSLSNLHVPEPSPYNARMSFADSHSGSGSSGGGERDRGNNTHSHSHSHQLHHQHHHGTNQHGYQQQSHAVATQHQHHQNVATSAAALRAELFVEASSRSSSSFSSSNTNDFELTDSLDDYVTMQQQQQQQQQTGPPPPPPYHAQTSLSASSSAAVHPMMAKELRGLSNTTISSSSGSATTTKTTTTGTSSSTATSTPMLAGGAHDHDDDFDDFIDMRTLNKQLCAMEQKQKAQTTAATTTTTTRSTNSNMFDLLCELACQTLGCPIASVSIVDAHGESIRSAAGLQDKPELHDELMLFIDKVMGSTPTIVLDANVDKQVSSLFTRRGAPQIRFFAGCPIHSRTGKKLGYVCVADFTKRDTLGASCAFTMERLATLAVTTMERNIASGKQPSPFLQSQSQQSPSQETFSNGYSSSNGYTSTTNNQTSHHHPTAIFDRPATGPGSAPQPRHRQSNATHPPMPHHHYQPSPQYHSAAQAYQYQDAYPVGVTVPPAAHTARVYDLAESDEPVYVGSPVAYHHHHHHHASRGPVAPAYHPASSQAPPPPPPPPSNQSNGVPPVAPLPRQYNEYSAGYYEAQERMRKLLIKSYNTSQQLATGSTPVGASAPTSAAFQAQY